MVDEMMHHRRWQERSNLPPPPEIEVFYGTPPNAAGAYKRKKALTSKGKCFLPHRDF